MILAAASKAMNAVLTPPFRAVLVKSIGITIAGLVILWAAGTRALAALAAWFATSHPLDYPWYVDAFTTVAGVLSGVLLFVGLAFLVAPVTSAVAGLFLDDIAGRVEAEDYPRDPPGRPVPLVRAVFSSLTFTLAVVAVNLVAFVLLLVPGVNLVAFFVGNGYLLGREYFEMAAQRLMSREAARALRSEYRFTVFGAGLLMAAIVSVPVLNLITPLFGTAMMVHLVKALTRRGR